MSADDYASSDSRRSAAHHGGVADVVGMVAANATHIGAPHVQGMAPAGNTGGVSWLPHGGLRSRAQNISAELPWLRS